MLSVNHLTNHSNQQNSFLSSEPCLCTDKPLF